MTTAPSDHQEPRAGLPELQHGGKRSGGFASSVRSILCVSRMLRRSSAAVATSREGHRSPTVPYTVRRRPGGNLVSIPPLDGVLTAHGYEPTREAAMAAFPRACGGRVRFDRRRTGQ